MVLQLGSLEGRIQEEEEGEEQAPCCASLGGGFCSSPARTDPRAWRPVWTPAVVPPHTRSDGIEISQV